MRLSGAALPRAVEGAPRVGEEGRLDLILVTETGHGEASPDRVEQEAERLDPDGLMILARPSRAITSRLARLGLQPTADLLHIPEVATSRYVLPIRGNATRYALRRLVPLATHKRFAVRALALPRLRAFAPTTTVFRRDGARPLLDWLSALGSPLPSCTAIIDGAWRPGSATVLHRFGEGREPDLIAKVGGGARKEGWALREIAATVPAGYANVPRFVTESEVGGNVVVAQTPVSGRRASDILQAAPSRVIPLVRHLAQFLLRWNEATAEPRPFSSQDAEDLVLEPARRLAPFLANGPAELTRLQGICAACEGESVPFVAAHNDLTAANVLIDGGGAIGVVDWESASQRALPLGDLIYAAADFAAAVDGYEDRLSAFLTCYSPSGRLNPLLRAVVEEARRSLGLSDAMVELCVEACWLDHAENERRRRGGEEPPAPFLAILEAVIEDAGGSPGAALTREA